MIQAFDEYFLWTKSPYQSLQYLFKTQQSKMSRKNLSNLSSIHIDQPQHRQQNLQIYLRIKPNLAHPQQDQAIRKVNDRKVQMVCPYYVDVEKGYYYDHVFDRTVTNKDLFAKTMMGPIQNSISGFNSTVLICGMTGSGKTYTMFGEMDRGETDGIVFQTLGRMFEELRMEQHIKSKLYLSFYEIYNETIRDLLKEGGQNLNIIEDPQKGTIINDLCQFPIETEQAAKDLLRQGLVRRSMDATRTNEVSSRSHAIVQFQLKRFLEKGKVQESKMFLIDLAGNEKSHNNLNKRFVEGVNINKSLLTLGKCISILAEQKKNAFVPFRDSKLTRILKESLGGNSKTVMVACVSSDKAHYEQTLNTLKFSSVAKNIKNKASRNVRQANKSDLSVTGFVANSQNEPDDRQLFELLTNLVSNIEEKFKIENIIKNLVVAKEANNQNQTQVKILTNLLADIEEERIKIIEHGQNQYNHLIEFIFQRKDNNYSHLQKTISDQKKQIQALTSQKQSLSKQLNQQTALITSLRHQQSIQQTIPNNTTKKQSMPFEPVKKSAQRMVRFTLQQKRSSGNGKRADSALGLSTINNSVRTTNREQQSDKENIGGRRPSRNGNQKKPKQVLIDLNPKRQQLHIPQVKDIRENDRSIRNSSRSNKDKDIERGTSGPDVPQYDMSPQQESIFKKLRINQTDLRSTSRLKSHSSERSLLHSKSQTRKFGARFKI